MSEDLRGRNGNTILLGPFMAERRHAKVVPFSRMSKHYTPNLGHRGSELEARRTWWYNNNMSRTSVSNVLNFIYWHILSKPHTIFNVFRVKQCGLILVKPRRAALYKPWKCIYIYIYILSRFLIKQQQVGHALNPFGAH
jgi:hypothetical protein